MIPIEPIKVANTVQMLRGQPIEFQCRSPSSLVPLLILPLAAPQARQSSLQSPRRRSGKQLSTTLLPVGIIRRSTDLLATHLNLPQVASPPSAFSVRPPSPPSTETRPPQPRSQTPLKKSSSDAEELPTAMKKMISIGQTVI